MPKVKRTRGAAGVGADFKVRDGFAWGLVGLKSFKTSNTRLLFDRVMFFFFPSCSLH